MHTGVKLKGAALTGAGLRLLDTAPMVVAWGLPILRLGFGGRLDCGSLGKELLSDSDMKPAETA